MLIRRFLRACKYLAGALAGLLLLLAIATFAGDVAIRRLHPPAGQFIDTSAGRQHVVDLAPEAGAAAAATVVLLHGANANLADLLVPLGPLLRARHRVVAIDRPGNGWSERRNGAADAAPGRQAAVVREVLGKLGARRFVLAGHSTGGAVAAAYATAYPDDPGGLVLLAPVAHPWTAGLPWFVDLANAPGLGSLFLHTAALPLGYLTLDRLVARAFAPQEPPPDYIVRTATLLALRPATLGANLEDLDWLQTYSAAQAPQYAQITARTVIIAGTADRIVPPRLNARAAALRIPNANLVMLRGVGHMPHYAAPEQVVAAIAALAEADARRLTLPP